MTDRPQSTARRERLEAALRENLKRRKAQARGRAEDAGDPQSHDSAGFVADKPDHSA
ncbi:MAG: hypothetical protein M5U07_06380 [Xanthobacteraceae bacterium]|nr:hypothetical protein [Xanthobacteraceae bacterium]